MQILKLLKLVLNLDILLGEIFKSWMKMACPKKGASWKINTFGWVLAFSRMKRKKYSKEQKREMKSTLKSQVKNEK